MRTVAVVGLPSETLDRLRAALPAAELLHLTLEQIERTAAAQRLSAAVLGAEALRGRGAARLAVLALRHPELATVTLLPPSPMLPHHIFALGRAGGGALVIVGTDDHPERLRNAFAEAALASVAHTVERACRPAVPVLAAPNVMPALAEIRVLRNVRDLASACGVRLARLRAELSAGTSLTPRRLLAGLRVLMAARQLGDTTDSVLGIAAAMGYGSARAFEKACHDTLYASPHEVRAGGGLWFAGPRFRRALEDHRAA